MSAYLLKRGKHQDHQSILLRGQTGRRKTIALGHVSDKAARTALYHVERLIDSAHMGTPLAQDTADWLEKIPTKLRGKLVAAGIAKPHEAKPSVELGDYIECYISGRTDIRPNTRNILKQTKRFLVAFFGADRDLTTINRGEARDWDRGMRKVLAEATASAYVKRARLIFADAVDRKLIGENPFDGIRAGSQVNESRRYFVPTADVLRIMDQCPDAEWRAVFALARFGGLRVPSETRRLRWSDVNFDTLRMTVTSPKTDRHAGKDKRVVPIFPGLLTWLREAFEQADDGAVHVVSKHRGENLRTTTLKFIERAGLVAWPKLFQNMRSTRQTELEDLFPTHVVCAWLGNSPKVAQRHYLQTTDEHFVRATKPLPTVGAAPGAAQQHALEASVAHHNGKNPEEYKGIANKALPPVGDELRPFRRGILGVRGEALRRALRRLEGLGDRTYRSETARYRRRPTPAEGRATSSPATPSERRHPAPAPTGGERA